MTPQQFPQDFIDYIDSHTLVEVKGGTEREKFLQIWMVQVNGRVFARSWEKSSRSWFNAFRDQGVGQLKYDDRVLDVSSKPMSDHQLNLLVDKAYRQKYTQEHNLFYVNGITEPEYREYTMEFFLREALN